MHRFSVQAEGEPETVGNDIHWLVAIYAVLSEDQKRLVRERVRKQWSQYDGSED
jgi:hypothetical protein